MLRLPRKLEHNGRRGAGLQRCSPHCESGTSQPVHVSSVFLDSTHILACGVMWGMFFNEDVAFGEKKTGDVDLTLAHLEFL